MKRYSAATTWAARFALFGAAAVLLLLLTGAALLSLPGHATQAAGIRRRAFLRGSCTGPAAPTAASAETEAKGQGARTPRLRPAEAG